ncbi:hypothetical protein LCGC14_0487210 [marine sediment metagenome]|uniref:Uncharacterized protein n=1 Tax=marine sediment metagenome TaxID=412755 RepID=A0A0F9SQV3_9ZZZZ
MDEKQSKHPECEKIQANRDESQKLGAFLEWLQNDQQVTLCICDENIAEEYDEDRYMPIRTGIEKLLAKYFEVDLDKAELERQAMLAGLRQNNS